MEGGGGEAQLVIAGDQQLVLSASDAAQLLAQAGIQLSDQDQVIIGGTEDGHIQLGVDPNGGAGLSEEEAAALQQQQEELAVAESHGEILYIDPNDPQAAALLEQAGLTLGPDGTVQAIQGHLEEGSLVEDVKEESVLLPLAQETHLEHSLVEEKPTSLIEAQKQILEGELLEATPGAVSHEPEAPHIPQDIKPILTPSAPVAPSVKKVSSSNLVTDQQQQQLQQRYTTSTGSQQVVQVGPDQQQVMYSVTSEDGKNAAVHDVVSQRYGSANPDSNFMSKSRQIQNHQQRRVLHPSSRAQQQNALPQQTIASPQPQQRIIQQTSEPDLLDSALMAIENTKEGGIEGVATQDFLSSSNPQGDNLPSEVLGQPQQLSQGDPTATRVFVRCNYCNDFRTILNSETWESILNHILPVAKEELHTSFYGDLSKHFVRTLRIQVNGRQIVKTGTLMIPQCEVILTHSLICLKTKREFLLDKPNANFVADLPKHIKNTQFGTNRGNSLLCVFCNSPYTYEDYIRHVTPHQDAILATLNCFAGAYCATSYENMMKHFDPSSQNVCQICQEIEQADLRFQPCTKFSSEYNCTKKLQFAIDCFREKYGDNGFMRLNTSSVTRCSVCKNSQNVYCAVFHISTTVLAEDTQEVHDVDSQLCVCINCQKQFINIVMKEQDFEKKQLQFAKKNALIYTVQENLSNPTASIHSVRSADVAEVMPITKLMALSETDITTSRIKASYQCDLCGFYIDLTSLISNPNQTQKNDMILGVVLEHMVPHTESLIGVITSSAANQTFNLKFEVVGRVSEAAGVRKIHLSLQRKFKSASSNMEIPLDKDEEKTMLQIRAGVNTNNKGLHKIEGATSANQLIEVNKFIDRQRGKFSLLAQCGCNTTLLSLYAECRLCTKFSYPDFRLCGTIASVDLCENCVDTVLTLCLPTEPEVLASPEPCLVLGEEKTNGVNLIKKTVDEYEDTKLFDTSALLLSALRKHLVAALRKCWLDSSVMTVAAGFCEVKVKILAKKTIAPPGGTKTGAMTIRTVASSNRNGSSTSSTNAPPVRRRVIISNGSTGRVVNLAEAAQTASNSTTSSTSNDKEEEESVSAIQSFLEQTSSSSKSSVLDDVKVPAGIKITAAGKGVVNIRAIAESRASRVAVSPAKNKTITKTVINSSASTNKSNTSVTSSTISTPTSSTVTLTATPPATVPSSSSSSVTSISSTTKNSEDKLSSLADLSPEATTITTTPAAMDIADVSSSIDSKIVTTTELLQVVKHEVEDCSNYTLETPAKKKRINSSASTPTTTESTPEVETNSRSKRKRKEKKIFDL
ncbi:unnamed protein product [Lepeophtheirus salmonis]|uniref:(salmon louse) hypothetical protein n=1 Tax=Lepeophtheirus salmonis TaxID=72036 RepID=A0A7R8D6L2_LEPSM|nr:unnamed protein product [Lepeophtheirus salmonis]CAF3045129.1 unnamed protein product [Lepeophtheirus salmonis]